MIRSERLEFPGGSGATLAARLDWPIGRPRGTALFAHCFTCSKDLAPVRRIARALARRGFALLRFDFTGLGHSEGEFASTNFSSNVQDLVRAADYLREHHTAPVLLIGHSLGGSAVLAAAAQIPEARGVATIGAPFDPAHVIRHIEGDTAALSGQDGQDEMEVSIAGRHFPIRRQMLDDLASHRLESAIRDLRRPLLVMHAPMDRVVGIDHARRIFDAARHPKSFVSLDDADHLLSGKRDTDYVAALLDAWLSRYLPLEAEPPRVPEGEVWVERNEIGRFGQNVVAGDHDLLVDEPTRLGGQNSGPSPYDLLVGALGACTSMTLQMYADRKGWPLEHVEVRLHHAKIHAEDCAHCEAATGSIDRIEREIRIEGPLDDEQRSRLLEIADRCPVHRTLHSVVDVVTRMAPVD